MNTTISNTKKQTAFRLSEDLLKRLKARAKSENRSLNNYVEKVLTDIVYDEPNTETTAAMKDAKEHKNLSDIELAKFKEFLASL